MLAIADHIFTTGNLRLREDEREWQAVAAKIGVESGGVLLVSQVHRADVAIARRGRTEAWNRPEADVMVSDDAAAAIGVRVADCAPILIADRSRGVVAAAHAGWRGTVQRAGVAAVRALVVEFGSAPRDLVAAIGPCLGPCCGEVGPEVIDAFRQAGHEPRSIARWFTDGPSGRPYLDLWAANRDQLEDAGMAAGDIHVAGLCTRSHPDIFHSYRAHGPEAGRMVGVIRARQNGRWPMADSRWPMADGRQAIADS